VSWQERAKRSFRGKGAVGKYPLMYRRLRQFLETIPRRNLTVLDYGSGPGEVHTKRLRDDYEDCHFDSYDLSKDGTSLRSLEGQWFDVVVASNVLNVIEDKQALNDTINEIYACTAPEGMVMCNLPKSPRYLDVDEDYIEGQLKYHFHIVQRDGNEFLAAYPRRSIVEH
jgi:ubiquinone/menaquinone biosynthesis C-methylase UbiE